MHTLLIMAAMAGLLALADQDFRSRSINAWLLASIGLLLLLKGTTEIGVSDLAIHILYNLAFLALILAVVYLYFILKFRKIIPLADNLIGWGDICFWLVAAVCFSPLNFVLFFFVSVLLSLPAHGLVVYFNGYKEKTVPLAGWQAICLAGALLFNFPELRLSFYNDFSTLNLLQQI